MRAGLLHAFPLVEKADRHSKTHASLFSASLEQVSPPQRSKSVPEALGSPFLNCLFRICLTHDTFALQGSSSEFPRLTLVSR